MADPLGRSTLTGLRTFSVFAETGSVSRAAEALHVTPGAVSQQLKQLEELLNVPLLTRDAKRLELTRPGQRLAEQLSISFAQIRNAVTEVQKAGREHALRLKLMPSLAICWLLPHLASFYDQNPDIALDIATVPDRATTLDDADLAVRLGDGDWPGQASDLLFMDALIPVCAPELAHQFVRPRDLENAPLLHSAMRPEGWDIWFARHGVTPRKSTRTIRFSNAALAYQAAMSGVGVAMAQYPYVKTELAAGTLVAPFPEPVSTDMGYYLVRHKAGRPHPNVQKFREWILAIDSPKAPGASPPPEPGNQPPRVAANAG